MEDTLIEATAENPSGQTQTQDEGQPPLSPPFRSNEDIRGRVIGGSLADVKQFPWQEGVHGSNPVCSRTRWSSGPWIPNDRFLCTLDSAINVEGRF